MGLTRRRFLGGIGPLTLAPLLGACGGADQTRVTVREGAPGRTGSQPWPATTAQRAVFLHGVTSGDPLATAVILWTRVTPPAAADPMGSVDVEWRVARDPGLRELVSDGVATTDASLDFTLHVDALELEPGSTYYYQFRALGEASTVGRTKTLPAGSVERMRFGVVSCSNYPAGYFNVYGLLARADVDVFLHLGDYIYEYANGSFGDGSPLQREPLPARELISLEDYRARHAQYKTDPDLQELHRQHPCIAIWDDHEVANDSNRSGAQNHQPAKEGEFELRKAAAQRAYFEWLPLRQQGEAGVIYRRFSCGDLLDLLMLDTRLVGRDPPVDRCETRALADPERTMLGSEQEQWLASELGESKTRGARWRLIGQQVILAPVFHTSDGCVGSPDMWDGYAATRQRLLDALSAGGIDNVVVLTGDAHSSWAMDVASDPFDPALYEPATGRGSQLVEFVAPAVSSPAQGLSARAILESHPHVKLADQTHQGYVLLDVTHERALAEWYFVPSVRERSSDSELGGIAETRAGEAHVRIIDEPSVERAERPALAP